MPAPRSSDEQPVVTGPPIPAPVELEPLATGVGNHTDQETSDNGG